MNRFLKGAMILTIAWRRGDRSLYDGLSDIPDYS